MTRTAVFVLLFPCGAGAVELGQKLPDFRLKTPWGRAYTLGSFRQPVLLVFYQGQKSYKQNTWVHKSLAGMVKSGKLDSVKFKFFGIGNFRESTAPNWLLRYVFKKVHRKAKSLVLCDEDGRMMKKWGFRNGRSNIYVLDRERRLRWRSSGPLTGKRGRQLLRLVVRLTRQY